MSQPQVTRAMGKRQREQVVELLRCAADRENYGTSILVDVARDMYMRPYESVFCTRIVQAAFNKTWRMWNECNEYTWRAAMLEAALRVERGEWP